MLAAAFARLAGAWAANKARLLLFAGACVGVLLVLAKVRDSGRQAERIRQLERNHAAARDRAKRETIAAGMADHELDDGLRPPARRRR